MAVFVYSSYRDVINGFLGQYESRELAEVAIYASWVDEMLEWPDKPTAEEKEQFKREALIASRTPKASIQTWNEKMYDGYSLRYMASLGNYAYIVFDPDFKIEGV